MSITLIDSLVLAVLLAYSTLVLYLIAAVFRTRLTAESVAWSADQHPSVSIVIPFRNEAANLYRLLASLKNQDYKGVFEVILMNDGSTDDYATVLDHFSDAHSISLKVINFLPDPVALLTSKQQAIDSGISIARYPWIALTDADMHLYPNWLSALMRETAQGADLVFGHTIIGPQKKQFFHWFQSFQLECLFSCAFAFKHASIPGSCMGNNLLVRKNAYSEIGGLKKIGKSITEDRALLAAFHRFKKKIAATQPFNPTAMTIPAPTLAHYFHQLRRWTSGGFTLNSNLSYLGILTAFQNVCLLAALSAPCPTPVSLLSQFNFALTWIFLTVTLRKIKSPHHGLSFIVYYPLLVLESLLLLMWLPFKRSITWKERKL